MTTYNYTFPSVTTTTASGWLPSSGVQYIQYYATPEEQLASLLDELVKNYPKSDDEATIQITVKGKDKYTLFIAVGDFDE